MVLAVSLGCSGRSALQLGQDGSAFAHARADSSSVVGGKGDAPAGTGGVGGGGAADASSVGASAADGPGLGESSGGSQEVMPDGMCDTSELWYALAHGCRTGGGGGCLRFVPEFDVGWGIITCVGYVVIDGDGRVVDNDWLTGAAKQAWLDGLATVRFPCLSAESLQYMCYDMPI